MWRNDLQRIYSNKWKHPMLKISQLQPRNSESRVGGVLREIQNGVFFLPCIEYSIRVDLIIFLNYMVAPMIVIFWELFDKNLCKSLINHALTCIDLFVLFVCLWFIVPLKNFSLIWRRHHYQWRAANFELCLALMAIKQWGFFSVSFIMGYPFIMVISQDPWYLHLLPTVKQ